jgi:hypothetical protein
MTIDITLHCSYCGADFNNCSLEENLESISSCTNCLVDLRSNGKWTGIGYNIMQKLIEKHGIEKVRYTNQKLAFLKV